MENYIIEVISAIATFAAAYFGAFWALKNAKKEKYFEERKTIYYELATILPVVDAFVTQSDYLQGDGGSGNAEDKIPIMEMKLADARNRLDNMQKGNCSTSEELYKLETEINNLIYSIEKHKDYLQQMEILHKKFEEFEQSGKKNLLRLFASPEVWNSYIGFSVAMHNEYYCNIGVTKEDIVYHIDRMISVMRTDLQS